MSILRGKQKLSVIPFIATLLQMIQLATTPEDQQNKKEKLDGNYKQIKGLRDYIYFYTCYTNVSNKCGAYSVSNVKLN